MATPSIKLELTQMGQILFQKLEAYNEEVEKETEAMLQKIINDFDYEAYITPIVEDYIKRMIKATLAKTELKDLINKKVVEVIQEYRTR